MLKEDWGVRKEVEVHADLEKNKRRCVSTS